MSAERAIDPVPRKGYRRWSVWLAAALLVFGSAGSVLLYTELESSDQASYERYVSNLATYIQADMLGHLQEQLQALERMAARVAYRGLNDNASWQLNARLYLAHYDFYRALSVLDQDLGVFWTRGRGNDLFAAGEVFRVDEDYREVLARSASTGELVVTRPSHLPDGRPGLNFILPVGTGVEHLGFLAATVDIPQAVETMVPNLFREELVLHAVAHGREVYPFPAREAPVQWDGRFLIDLDEDKSAFLFEFALNDEIRAKLSSSMPRVVLVSGLLLSALLAVVVYLGLNAGGQARVLSASNRRLTSEIGEREAAERELEFLVHHDSLTGLPNRSGIFSFLGDWIERHGAEEGQLAVLFLDLDQFKDINDSLGHHLGDQLLCEVPRRLAGVLRDRDFIGRHGGDEFLIAVWRHNREQVEQLAANVLRALDGGFTVEDHRLFISGSIGIAYYPESAGSVIELIQNADTALFKAKNSGRNQFAVFTREMQAQTQHRLNLSRDIRHALEDGEFRLVYQPIIRIGTRRMCGVEALLRWDHRDGHTVPPDEFIRIAEETGIIGRLGQFAMERALSDLARWQGMHGRLPWLAVNVSGAQIREAGFAEQISVLLHQYRIAPEQLHLEITEEVLIENLSHNRRMLEKLDEIGMRIVVDDFGVGYSSLSYLKNFPISVVKIDRGFVRDIAADPEDQAITRTICSLAGDLGMQTVAEGVETVEQLDLLAGYACTFAQGYLFSYPVEADAIAKLIADDESWFDADS